MLESTVSKMESYVSYLVIPLFSLFPVPGSLIAALESTGVYVRLLSVFPDRQRQRFHLHSYSYSGRPIQGNRLPAKRSAVEI